MQRTYWLAVLLVAIAASAPQLVGCAGNECGPGTVEQGGSCVRVCPPGTVDQDGQCVTSGEVCGEGSSLVDGACRVNFDLCPTGQVYVDGECVHAVECADGTAPDENGDCVPADDLCEEGDVYVDGGCVPAVRCADGTVPDEDGDCVPADDLCEEGDVYVDGGCVHAVRCADGTVPDENGDCVPADNICDEGDVYVDGQCVPEIGCGAGTVESRLDDGTIVCIPTPVDIGTFAPGVSIPDTIRDRSLPRGESDHYRITFITEVALSGQLTATAGGDADLIVLDEYGVVFREATAGDESFVDTALDAGTYVIEVWAYSDVVDGYALKFQSTSPLKVPAPACVDEFIDYDCDARLPMDCSEEEGLIDSDPTGDGPCPVCRHPEPTDDTSCAGERVHYREFLEEVVSGSCANYCEDHGDCFAWELQNACGTYALALLGGIDEEPILFAEEFAATRCAVCGEMEQVEFSKRSGPGAEIQGPYVGGFGSTDGEYESVLLPYYSPVCVESQCLLQW